MNKKVIYAISGKANSGKDTIASIILYLSIKGFADDINFEEQYLEWYYNRNKYKSLHNNLHFADNLKKSLALLFDIDKNVFDDRYKKDNFYLKLSDYELVDKKELIEGKELINEKDIEELNNSTIIINEDLEDMYMDDYIYHLNKLNYKNIYINIRTLMQYFGTNICRNIIDENIWIKSLLKKVNRLYDDVICISDVRFKNEQEALLKLEETNNYKIVTIKTIRPDNQNNGSHESERIDFDCNYEITCEDLRTLFRTIKAIYYENSIS